VASFIIPPAATEPVAGRILYIYMSSPSPASEKEFAVGSPVWPVIQVTSGEVTVGRTSDCSVCLQHASISRLHAKFIRTGQMVEVEDLDSRFGTFVNGSRVKRTALKIGDSVRIGSSPPYRFGGDSLEPVLDGSGIALKLADVAVEREGRRLIGGINLTLQPDTFVGVLGPSGAGKSVLLSVLNSTVAPTSGLIQFDDGVPLKDHLAYFRSKLGIVTQDDLVYVDLTVEENLQLAAMVRMPDVSPESLERRVNAALESVGLIEHRIKRVGVLSGGQRKRVSVAVEMLMQPRLLLLDEPTSGLDPGMQSRLMELLRGLARRGVTVVCTTHTLDTLNYFDQVIVLGLTGHVASVVYQGDPRKLLSTFGVGSQADLFDKLQELAGGNTPAATGTTAVAKAAPDAEAHAVESAGTQRPRMPPPPPPEPGGKRIWQQAQVVCRRTMLGLLRDKASTLLAFGLPPFLALLIILAQSNQPMSIALLFFTVLVSVWLGLTLTVREIVRERKLYIRDRLAGLHPDGYLLGKLMYAGIVTVMQTILIWFIIRFIAPSIVNDQAADKLRDTSIIMGFIILFLTGIGSAMLGLILSTWCTTERAAVTFMPLILLPQVLLSRVIYGEPYRGVQWPDPSPYMPFLHLVKGDSVTADPDDPKKTTKLVVATLSLPMLTRPGAAALDMLANTDGVSYVFAEFIYLLIVVAGYGTALYFLFRRQERTWNDIR
jgi:ABC transport system ATP-binding/permease protein